MDLENRDLSPEELRLVDELRGLVSEPDQQRRAQILAAVRAASFPHRTRRALSRLALAPAAALLILVATSAGALAASTDALPSSPNYPLRIIGEQLRLTFAGPTMREELRIKFAQSRISQARSALRQGDRSDARNLLHGSRDYLNQTRQDLPNVPSGEQGSVQNQLNQAVTSENQAEAQLNQEGAQGQQGG